MSEIVLPHSNTLQSWVFSRLGAHWHRLPPRSEVPELAYYPSAYTAQAKQPGVLSQLVWPIILRHTPVRFQEKSTSGQGQGSPELGPLFVDFAKEVILVLCPTGYTIYAIGYIDWEYFKIYFAHLTLK